MSALDNEKKLGVDAMGPCHICKRQLLATGLPIFYRVQVSQCALDRTEIQRHVGLAMTMGGGADGLALAGILGPKVEPVAVMFEGATVNVCASCQNGPGYLMLAELAFAEPEGKTDD